MNTRPVLGSLRTFLLSVSVVSLLAGCESMDISAKMAKEAHAEGEAAATQNGAALRLARAARAVHDFNGALNLYKSITTARYNQPSRVQT